MTSLRNAQTLLSKGLPLSKGMMLKLIPLDQLHFDRYQRPLVKNTVNIIHRNLDERALGIVHVGKRGTNGKFYVIDGQNRVVGLRERRAAKLKTPNSVLCSVFINTTYKQEAELFEKLNTVRPVSGNAKFWTRLQYDARPEVMIQKAVLAEGFDLDFVQQGRPSSTIGNGIRGMYGLLQTWNKLPNQLQPALQLLREAWGRGDAFLVPHEIRVGDVVHGLALFLHNRGQDTVSGLSVHLRKMDLGEIWTQARRAYSGYARTNNLAEILNDCCRGYRKKKAA